jgi:hypothetical protein
VTVGVPPEDPVRPKEAGGYDTLSSAPAPSIRMAPRPFGWPSASTPVGMLSSARPVPASAVLRNAFMAAVGPELRYDLARSMPACAQ